ncbi:hypothetical protein RB195_014333 [Necator americanus]|uniref:Uncharacterized protein n=1 Tax=Necator americanus TaxID=51031 RepID=A0ABR1DZJ6_NECAM
MRLCRFSFWIQSDRWKVENSLYQGESDYAQAGAQALIMVVRLAHSIYKAIRERTNIQDVTIYSDSKIAPSWTAAVPAQISAGVPV